MTSLSYILIRIKLKVNFIIQSK